MGSPDVYVGVRRVLSIHSGHLWPYPRESWVEGSRGKTRRLADKETGVERITIVPAVNGWAIF